MGGCTAPAEGTAERAAVVALGVVVDTGAAGVGVGTGVTLLSTLELRDWMGDSSGGGGGGWKSAEPGL